jgi:methionyl-tRNA synthetase
MLQGSNEEKRAAQRDLVAVLEAVRVIAVLLAPVTPGLSRSIYAALGCAPEDFKALSWGDARWGGLPAGQATPPPKPIFARLEGDLVTEAAPGSKAAVAA